MLKILSRRPAAIVFSSLLLVSGCGSLMHSKFVPPDVQIPSHWQTTQVSQNTQMNPWWERFNDPRLNGLIERVLTTNNDLALATLTLQKARLQAGLTAVEQFPSISSSTSAHRDKSLKTGEASTHFSTALSVSYELDLWGRVSSALDTKTWIAVASEFDREATAQSLVSTTASLYWQIGYLNQRINYAKESIDYVKQTLKLTQKQYKAGAVSALNVLEARQHLASQESSFSELQHQLTKTENALSILYNQPPDKRFITVQTLPDARHLPPIQPGIPSDVLVRRPDVKSALYALRAALATKDATLASYFPTLTLTGSVNGSSSQLHDLLKDPIGTLGAGIVLPFLQWHEMQLNRNIAALDYETAIINYRQTLYNAFQDVNNALSARQQYDYQASKLQEQYDAAKLAERIYASQYHHGAVSIQDWLDAQEALRTAKESLIENQYNRFNIQATLYEALGGVDVMARKK